MVKVVKIVRKPTVPNCLNNNSNITRKAAPVNTGRRLSSSYLSLLSAFAIGLLNLSAPAASADTSPDPNLEYESFYLEGSLIHAIRPKDPDQPTTPLIMIPGLNLSSYIFTTTPDNRDGWAQIFARAGYDVYVINDPRFDFSHGFNVPGFDSVPEKGAPPAQPNATQGWQNDVWRRWGFGSSIDNPHPDTRFPTDHYQSFAENHPYLATSRSSFPDAIAALLEETGPAILMPHSAAGPHAITAAKKKPDHVTGFVLIEPTGPPIASDFPDLAGQFMLGIYGDYIFPRRQTGRKAAVENATRLFSQHGAPAQVISLPDDKNIKGNTHLLMQDNNNHAIADLIIAWLKNPVDNPPAASEITDDDDGPARTRGRGMKKGARRRTNTQ